MSGDILQAMSPESALNEFTGFLGSVGLASLLHQAACAQSLPEAVGVVQSRIPDEKGPGYRVSVGRETTELTFGGNGPYPYETRALYEKLAAMVAPSVED